MNIHPIRLYPDEATQLKRELAKVTRELDDAYDTIHELRQQLRAAIEREKEGAI